jgi:hypothetical protein
MTDETIATLRRILFATLAVGAVGTEGELLLLGHFEDWRQYGPLILLALVFGTQGWFVSRARRRASAACAPRCGCAS